MANKMANSSENGHKNFIEFTIPFFSGIKIRFGGREVFSIIITLLAISFIGYFIHIHDENSTKTAKLMIDTLQEHTEAMEAMTWMMTRTEEEKTKIQLSKPKKIRELEFQLRKHD